MPPVCNEAEVMRIALNYRPGDAGAMIHLLQDIQSACGYLSRQSITTAAEHLDVPLPRAFQIATFYKAFRLSPRGETTLRICTGTSCHIRGAAIIADEISAVVGAKPGQTSPDGRYSVEAVNCVGACALAPVLLRDDQMIGQVTPGTVARRLKETEKAL
jgi:NADH-quinone oxidoreductase subunit E